ncbi:MAG: sulfatase [Bacteroidales bacterium]|nr:sulfatase [Bacteroidales bacterium]
MIRFQINDRYIKLLKDMNLRFLIILMLNLISAGIFAQGKSQPNVLMLVVDDWNDMIGAFGGNQAITPNMDRLCKQGIKFTNCQTAGSYCTPSRTALMTGIAPWESGCYGEQPHHYNMPDQKTIPALFKENGYTTFGGGKVYHHMPGYVDLNGYDEYFHWNPEEKKRGWGVNAWKNNPATPAKIPASDFGKTVYTNFDVCALPNDSEKDMADTKMVDWTINLIEKGFDKPFFISAGLYSPHKPNFAPQKYFDLYPIENIQIPEIKEDDMDDLPEMVQRMVAGKSRHTHQKVLKVENGWKRAIQGYLASVSYADAQLGRILEALEKSPYAQNTIIVFWSDNGYHLGEKECWAKHTLWERTTNVPMIWAGKGIAKNKEYKGVVSLLDIYPTLADMCQLKGVENYSGESIEQQLKKPSRVKERAVLTANKKGDAISVYTNEWHYINYGSGKAEELYNANDDKHEWYNLANDEAYASVLEEMRAHIPTDMAKPATGREHIRMVFEGESFYWREKTEKEKQAYRNRERMKKKRIAKNK